MSYFRCWECHEYAPGGVCTRPHPGFDLRQAVSGGHVVVPVSSPLSGRTYAGGQTQAEYEAVLAHYRETHREQIRASSRNRARRRAVAR